MLFNKWFILMTKNNNNKMLYTYTFSVICRQLLYHKAQTPLPLTL